MLKFTLVDFADTQSMEIFARELAEVVWEITAGTSMTITSESKLTQLIFLASMHTSLLLDLLRLLLLLLLLFIVGGRSISSSKILWILLVWILGSLLSLALLLLTLQFLLLLISCSAVRSMDLLLRCWHHLLIWSESSHGIVIYLKSHQLNYKTAILPLSLIL